MNWRTLALTVGGLGLLRPAPGTWGSLPPVIVAGVMVLAGASLIQLNIVMIALLIASSIACVALGRFAEQRFGGKDPSSVVADETAGQAIPLIAMTWPTTTGALDTSTVVAVCAVAFVSFRFFDITKIPPANQLQKLPAGWGVLVDDLIAGVYAWITTWLTVRYLLPVVGLA
ncbi:MAG: phosphatidylglycerophosphatase A [Planctomycetota bacterium]